MTRRAPAPKADRERARNAASYADELSENTRGAQRAYHQNAERSPEWKAEYWRRYIDALHAAHDAAEVAADAFEAAIQNRKARSYRARAKRIRDMFGTTGAPRRDPPSRPRRISDRPRSAEGNENLAYLLDRDVRAIGPERAAAPPAPDIRLLISPSGSYRYVGLENGRPVSALQIMSYDGGIRGTIMNVYTTPVARRRGWAARLLAVARRRFREVKHSSDLSAAGEAWKGAVRDADYRGQKVPFDFARAVFEVRRGRPGALEVLRDGIEEWFPRQFATAVAQAEHWAARTGIPRVVEFRGRVARNRFRPWQDVRSTLLSTPFVDRSERDIERYGTAPYSVVVWPRAFRAPRWKDL